MAKCLTLLATSPTSTFDDTYGLPDPEMFQGLGELYAKNSKDRYVFTIYTEKDDRTAEDIFWFNGRRSYNALLKRNARCIGARL